MPNRPTIQLLPTRRLRLLHRARIPTLWLSIFLQTFLLLIALIPQSVWADYGYPSGPIPAAIAPLVAALFYLLPPLIGALCQHWYSAIILSTFPAWIDLGVFATAAARRIGPFYLVQDPHATNTVSTLELFSLLGVLGWLACHWLRKPPHPGASDL